MIKIEIPEDAKASLAAQLDQEIMAALNGPLVSKAEKIIQETKQVLTAVGISSGRDDSYANSLKVSPLELIAGQFEMKIISDSEYAATLEYGVATPRYLHIPSIPKLQEWIRLHHPNFNLERAKWWTVGKADSDWSINLPWKANASMRQGEGYGILEHINARLNEEMGNIE